LRFRLDAAGLPRDHGANKKKRFRRQISPGAEFSVDPKERATNF